MADEFEPPELGPLRDNSLMWRLSMWGGAATVAVGAAILITQTDIGAGRLVAGLSQPRTAATQMASNDDLLKRVEAQRLEETKRLEARIRDLTADRDRLNARVASLEQNFTDVTGTIKRDLAIVAATAPTAKPVPETRPAAPTVSAPTTVKPAESQPAEAKAEPKVEPKSEAKAETAAPAAPSGMKAETAAAAKPEASTETAAAETPAQKAAVPMPPVRVAAVSPQAATSAPETVHTSQLAVEIGGARSIEILNARWAAVKANFGPLIEGLSPLVRRDNRPGIIPYRLIVGPLPNGAAAAELCSRLHASKVACRTTTFSGDKFAQQ
ncbi:MAG: hypothetical protein JSR61_12480 [Proteobacteria bacterium]|nr:hypothetical protein [Pseudomonadota bacterium]